LLLKDLREAVGSLIDVKIHLHKDEHGSVEEFAWRGGAAFASLSNFGQKTTVAKKEVEETKAKTKENKWKPTKSRPMYVFFFKITVNTSSLD